MNRKIEKAALNVVLAKCEYLAENLKNGLEVCGYRYPIIIEKQETRVGLNLITSILDLNNLNSYKEKMNRPYIYTCNTYSVYHIIWFATREHYLEFVTRALLLRDTGNESSKIKELIKQYSCNFSPYFINSNVDTYLLGIDSYLYEEDEDFKKYEGLKSDIVIIKNKIKDLGE